MAIFEWLPTSNQKQEGNADELFHQIVEMAPSAIVLTDQHGVIELVNTQTERIFGFSRIELIGQSIDLLLPERLRSLHPHYRQTFLANPSHRSMGVGRELFGARRDGSEFPLEIGLNPIMTPEGMKVLSAIVDISERKRQENQFRQVVEKAPNAMVMVGLDGSIEMVNAQTEKIFGYARADLLGKSIDILLPERFRGNHPHHRMNFFANSSPRSMGVGRDLFGLRQDGREFPVEIGLNPIHTADGMKVLSAIVDISERKEAEIRQQELIAELTRINEELNNFAYVSSHDLKSPLRGIDQLATWISEDLGQEIPEETRNHLELMRNRIRRMEMLLDDLLAYSRVGRTSNEMVLINTHELVKNIFELTASTKQIELRINGALPVLRTRKVPLELVLRNLISNAIKHHDKPFGVIEISANLSNEYVEFFVKDDGPGIAPEHQQRVFGMFQTLKPRDDIEGSGIGLALIRKAVEVVGGKVSVESDGKNGCLFCFTWPLNIVKESA
jgi:PAS domain S-box-containing protein